MATVKFAIIALTQFKGGSTKLWINSGVVCSASELDARIQFAEFLKANPVRAKLIRTNADRSDGETIAESEYSAPMVV